jgi:hypothetical protein
MEDLIERLYPLNLFGVPGTKRICQLLDHNV